MDKQLLERVTQPLGHPSTSSSTTTGDTPGVNEPRRDYETGTGPSPQQRDAINQIFALLRYNYHNQFTKAFPDLEAVKTGKRLWLNLLAEYPADVLLKAAERAVKECTWLPNVHEIIVRCDLASSLGVPDSWNAYLEACRAPTPKREQRWSHPIVYLAGKASDWFFLANNIEEVAYPVYERNYAILLRRLLAGEALDLPMEKGLPDHVEHPLPRQEQQQRLRDLIADFDHPGRS
ncbi:replicative helicase loader/inhibitor [Parathalassolituus penaei]|uniref:Replicative helicase loader/inhibitor n=1 Tax=Parathalassolituus penaei TaxID=2997323 RepID=A0A9X3IT48_9GAMM|nr:replicative helicase loader/inhibitor [Parathalassolituus penaei]MCY0964823.1 replicative helicase loader/inhibitor [Parathalassolituus penaei]